MFHAWPDGTEKFRVEAMSGLSFGAMAEPVDQTAHSPVACAELAWENPYVSSTNKPIPASDAI